VTPSWSGAVQRAKSAAHPVGRSRLQRGEFLRAGLPVTWTSPRPARSVCRHRSH
jgi:hypothetical protein